MKVMEDLSLVILLRKKFDYLESIPGVLLPHPSSSACPMRIEACTLPQNWPAFPPVEFYDHFSPQMRVVTPSMSSLDALLSKLPPVGLPPPTPVASLPGYFEMPVLVQPQKPSSGVMEMERVAKEEMEEEHGQESGVLEMGGECSSSMSYYVNVAKADEGF
ncbi:hypothetical protein BHM03_00013585 [Ensete ventricosum]|uniref:Uncharacterized protein n=1 Tax=Ensete ventricosum TaxID=4639 RepID=A0A426ZPT2_ENSVE|nr:hypothetical protein B296_00018025 [Ensete ventricosum]RZR86397.1 hypothetical protein BHM03_00013585 [Ensete ventricosum]